MSEKIKRIALIGPESTGKTTLSKQLADHYKTVWVPEYARVYVESLERPYTQDDIEHCAKKQLETEDEFFPKANQFLFCDTELILAKIWCEDVFKACLLWIEDEIPKRKYDLYLLTWPDLSFKADPVRENPGRREYFFDLYRSELEKRKFNFSIIKGEGKKRFENALKALEGLGPGG
jgi:NadR type nicotinamide-nucleotide adenylyltransferase